MVVSIVYLRLLAILLIVNCHLGAFYPKAAMAFGGYLGNGLFYFVSGYGLMLTQMKKPLTAKQWFIKRLTRILIPFLFYISVIHIGDWDKFAYAVYHNLLIHTTEQLQFFFGVLWVLYILFLPINKLNSRNLSIFLGVYILAGLIYMIWEVNGFSTAVPKNFPTTGLYFLYSGIMNFILGILACRYSVDQWFAKKRSLGSVVWILALILVPQILHQVLYKIDSRLVFLNLYFNIISIVGLYFFACLPLLNFIKKFINPLYTLAGCSLAVYFVHFLMMDMVAALGLVFPYNVLAIFLYTFIFSYPLTRMANFITTHVLAWMGEK